MADRKKRATYDSATSKARKWQGIVAICQKWQREQTLVQGTSQLIRCGVKCAGPTKSRFKELLRHVGDWLNKP